MTHPHSRLKVLFVKPVLILGSIIVIGCGDSVQTPAAEPLPDPKPGEFDQLSLRINARDALGGKVVISRTETFRVSGGFRFVKPYKGLAPVRSVVLYVVKTREGKEVLAQAGVDNLEIGRDRKAKFSCELRPVVHPGVYTLKVLGNSKTCVMQVKLTVD